jgi:2-amino-4-hydroxy-6-hydroxymethyldihydropteridine diphosphokinase
MINSVYVAFGSNIGDREDYIMKAIQLLTDHNDVDMHLCSSMLETKAVSQLPQPDYLNAVAAFKTILSAREFFELTQSIEQKLGRLSKGNYDPRTIDLDIILFNDEVISDDDLIVPHPLMHEREFVLHPLLEINPSLLHPIFNLSMSQLLEEIALPTL